MGMVVEQRVAGVSRFSAVAGGRSFLQGRIPPPLTPPHKGEGEWRASRLAAITGGEVPTSAPPSPLWGSVGRARQAAHPGRVRGGGDALRDDIQRRNGNLPISGNHPCRDTEGGPLPRHPAHPRTRMAAVYP